MQFGVAVSVLIFVFLQAAGTVVWICFTAAVAVATNEIKKPVYQSLLDVSDLSHLSGLIKSRE